MLKNLFLFMGLAVSANLIAKPAIDAAAFARFSEFSDVQLSPTGKYLAAVVLGDDGEHRVSILATDTMQVVGQLNFDPFEEPGRLTWLNDERIGLPLYYTKGSLDYPITYGDYYAFNVDGSHREMLWGFRNEGGLAINPTVSQMQIVHLLPEDPRYIIVTERILSRNASQYNNAYRLNVYSGRKREIASAPIKNAYMLADHSGEIRFAMGVDAGENNTLKLFSRDPDSGDWSLFHAMPDDQGEIVPLAFGADNKTVYALSDYDAPTKGIVTFNIDSPSEPQLIYRHPEVDVESVQLSHDLKLVSASVSPDYTYIKTLTDHPLAQWTQALQQTFGDQVARITSATRDGNQMVVYVASDKNPGTYYLFDAQEKKLKKLVDTKSWIDPQKMAEVQPFRLTARDGETLTGYLTLPPNAKPDTPVPLIVHPHGGPHGPRDYWGFDSTVQWLAQNGFAVLQLNFRGSGGYGRDFMASGYGEWGAVMQDDLTDATRWAVNSGYADPERLCIFGASYGGYAALMGVVKEPDLYKCAVGYVGVYDLPMMLEEGDIPDSRVGVNYLRKVLGEDIEAMKARSPAYQVDKIKAALFIVHGGKDQRVPMEQYESLTEALDARGYPYESMVEDNEGHGFYKLENRTELNRRLVTFFNKHIKP
ncbi:S9 family peptidase [Aestuariibacter halophilus]|uniref:S9 family peptidase n=1 Tax=Fluctibacter halophilus TaxID=226011 RepID=A0ABS8G2Y7_9ALTE|nr:S9 family peptidase [Aestuariibacter halophilus]MCC2614930.1 S9 family peptidase [Aestuariibacter halophilus]